MRSANLCDWANYTSTFQAIDADIEEFMKAARERRFGDAYVIMEKRSGLIIGIVFPLLFVRSIAALVPSYYLARVQILRWPGAALAVLRGVTPVLTFVIGIASRTLAHNPRLFPLVAGLLQRLAATSWRQMAVRSIYTLMKYKRR